MELPLLYNPPKGTPPEAAQASLAKFNEADTWDKIMDPLVSE